MFGQEHTDLGIIFTILHPLSLFHMSFTGSGRSYSDFLIPWQRLQGNGDRINESLQPGIRESRIVLLTKFVVSS